MVEGNSAAANADGLIYDVMAAFHTACASFIGQNYGAGNRDRVRRTYWISLSYSFAAGAGARPEPCVLWPRLPCPLYGLG